MSLDSTLLETKDCLLGPITATSMRRMFLMLTRVHWGDSANHGDPIDDLDCILWSKDPRGTLSIELLHEYDRDNTDNLPGIFVGMGGPMKFDKKVLDNLAGESDDLSTKYFSTLRTFDMVFKHVHRSADTALSMADSTATFLASIRGFLMGKAGMRQMDVVGMTAPKIHEKSPQIFFEVDVVLTVNATFTVGLATESHRLKRFVLHTTQ